MHKYVIKLTRYTETGAPTSEVRFEYADTPQGLADKQKQYNSMHYTTTDEEGHTTIGGKMWKVEPMQAEYVAIADWDAFCEVNKVLR